MSEKKIALVTGASRGIGYAVLKNLNSAGYFVIGTATSEENVQKLKEKMDAENIDGVAYTLNVADVDSIAKLQEQCASHGLVQILVNNAAITRDNLFLRMSTDEWQSIMDTNLSSIFHLCKAFTRPMMKARWGRIINLSSFVGFIGNMGQTNYSAAKAAVVGFSKSLAREVSSRGITVNAVVPGFIETDMTKVLPEEQKEQLIGQIPVGRFGQPEDIANAVEFLCSDKANYVTGQSLHVNGGLYMG